MVHVYGEPEDRDFLYPEEAFCSDLRRVEDGGIEVLYHPAAYQIADGDWECGHCGETSSHPMSEARQ